MREINPTLFQPKAVHPWLRQVRFAYIPGADSDPLIDEAAQELKRCYAQAGHTVLEEPQGSLDILLTSARFNQPVRWREALFFTARRRFSLERMPTVFTALRLTPRQFEALAERFTRAAEKEPPDPADYAFPGMAEQAYLTLHEQGRRGGPILPLARVLQSQSMCIRLLLFIGEDRIQEGYVFDLVGAHPRIDAANRPAFFEDIMLRMLTAVSTHEITQHEVVGEPVSQAEWQALETPAAMRRAGLELGRRNFFTEMVRVGSLVNVPTLDGAIASQYSEGCFGTWDTHLNGLVVTITGSARPVVKDRLTDDELAIIAGIRPDGRGARVRHVEGKRNDPPSSEAVEMMEMDAQLPRIQLDGREVPVARSKLHGHRSVSSYDPRQVEHVFLDPPFYHYPVSCSTEAQAGAIQSAFSRSEALNNPADPRHLVFTVLPGHGVVIVEKWVPGKAPFQAIWEAFDSGALAVDRRVPQGPLTYRQLDGRMALAVDRTSLLW